MKIIEINIRGQLETAFRIHEEKPYSLSHPALATPDINQLISLLHFMLKLFFNKCDCDIIKNDDD